MSRHTTLAWALACALVGGTAAAAQELVYPDSPDSARAPVAMKAAATAPPIALQAVALSADELKVSWTAIPNDDGVTIEYRTSASRWLDIGPVRMGPACKGCAGAVHVVGVAPGETYMFRLRAAGVRAPISNEAAATAYFAQPPACVSDSGALCLRDRYRVDVRYEGGPRKRGRAGAVDLTEASGYFWFAGPNDIQLMVKLIDGCAVNKHRWVFLAGLTSLRVLTVVTDTWTGATSTYLNEMNQPFPTVQDVGAFKDCN